jgi:imidazolonepropionase
VYTSNHKNAYLLLEDNLIADFGSMYSTESQSRQNYRCKRENDLTVWCDSHTHIVYAGNREQEFVDHKWPQL